MIEICSSGAPGRPRWTTAELLAAALFALAAAGGWIKLKYGLNFIDEGLYMTGGWRLAQGDPLLFDHRYDALFMYRAVNGLVFGLVPDITLLGFRKLQFVLAIAATLSLVWIFRARAPVWLLLAVASVFAFVGLDYMGNASTLSYYTVPQLFLILYSVCFVSGLRCQHDRLKPAWFAASGVFLWGVGFSVLPLAVVSAAPVATWFLCRAGPGRQAEYETVHLAATLMPVAALWLGFLAFNAEDFLTSASAAWGLFAGSGLEKQGELVTLRNIQITAYLGMVGVLAYVYATLILPNPKLSGPAGVIVFGALTYLAIRTNLGGLLPADYWNGWFFGPTWFCGLLAVTVTMALTRIAGQARSRTLDAAGLEAFSVLVPGILLGAAFAAVSGLGLLAAGYSAIPVLLAATVVLYRHPRLVKLKVEHRALALIVSFAPFLVYLAEHDWQWTYFDLPPRYLNHEIEAGFAKGIITNPLFAKTELFIRAAALNFTGPDDFILAYPNVPMVYMLAKRRPANFQDYWVSDNDPVTATGAEIKRMTAAGRNPKMIVRFRSYPTMRQQGQDASHAYMPAIPDMAPGFQFDAFTLEYAYLAKSLSAAPISPDPLLDIYVPKQ